MLILIIETVYHNRFFIKCDTFEDAQSAWNSFRDTNGVGASEMEGDCGDVIDKGNRNRVARVHYNGRIEHYN